MTTPGSEHQPEPEKQEVRQLQAYVFGPDGPFPLARMHHRLIAFLLDFTLIGAFAMLVLVRGLLPMLYPAELAEFNLWYAEYAEDLAAGERSISSPDLLTREWSEPVLKMLLFSQNFILFCYWIYFAAAETFFQGKSIGKRAFSLKVMDMRQVRPLELAPAMLRSLVKALCIFAFFPVFILGFLIAWLTPFRRTGHDYLARSVVVEDNARPDEEAEAASAN